MESTLTEQLNECEPIFKRKLVSRIDITFMFESLLTATAWVLKENGFNLKN
jgi:hypothetical protein